MKKVARTAKKRRSPKPPPQSLPKVNAMAVEIERLRAELEESKDTLRAIQAGEVDALVVNTHGGEQIFTLKSADHPYRILVETMGEGAATLSRDGTVFYANVCLSQILGYSLENTIGTRMTNFVADEDQGKFLTLFEQAQQGRSKGEILLKTKNRGLLPTVFSMSAFHLETEKGICIVITDLTEQKHLAKSKEDNEQLKLMGEKTKMALAARDEFLSIASHELKTPLTSLKLQLQLTRRGTNPAKGVVPSADELDKALVLALKQVVSLSNLVEDLLDVSRIQSGKLTLSVTKTNLSSLTRDVVSQLKTQLESAQCPVRLELDADVTGHWDRHRIEQVVVNLLSNAIKYAPKNQIHITTARKGEIVQLIVQDFGPGIEEEKREKIFERFERLGSSRHIGGLGLGLFIVRNIVESHHGKVYVESVLGQGSKFVVELPIDPNWPPA